jgi:hypothetical protein
VVLAVGATTDTFDVVGTARDFSIPAGGLADGTWEIRVYAYNDGDFTGPTESGSAMNIRGEAADYPSITVGEPLVVVTGADMSAQEQHITISEGGTVVDGATVTVNTEAALQAAPGASYDVTLVAPVAVGGTLDLDISFGTTVIQGTGTVPELPVITAPLDNAVILLADPIVVTWTSTANPDRFNINVPGSGYSFDVLGTERTYTIPAGTLVAGAYQIHVIAYNHGTFTGPADPTSRMNIGSEAADPPDVTINP